MGLSIDGKKITNQNSLFAISAFAVIMLTVVWFLLVRDFLPLEWHAKKYSLGVFSKLELPGFMLFVFGIGSAFRNIAQSLLLLTASFLTFYFCYFGAFEIAKFLGADTYSVFVNAEIGCFPDKWIPFLEQNDLPLAEHVQLCSQLNEIS